MKNTLKKFQAYQIDNLHTIKGGDKGETRECPSPEEQEGYIVTSDLQDWWRACRDGQYDRRDISIILNDNAANEIRRWNL
ncbi:MAG TPA: hypothetical protein DCS93_09455 [Microscillaceae bacterium]|nr:hypothetical protein [Microscillaceae bacterium]